MKIEIEIESEEFPLALGLLELILHETCLNTPDPDGVLFKEHTIGTNYEIKAKVSLTPEECLNLKTNQKEWFKHKLSNYAKRTDQ